MKKFVSRILSLGLALTAATAAAEADMPAETTKALSVGSVTVYDFGDVKLHAYNMGDALSDECYLLESGEGLVMLETGAFTDQLNAWKDYIDGLDKPLAGALLAYHPNGIEVFGDIPVYATEKALSNWGKGGSIRGLTDGFVATFGDGVAANLPTKANLIKTGDTVTLAGMDFVIREEGDDAYGVEIPQINCVYIHMLGSKCHNILTSREHMLALAEELRGFQYTLVLTSHYVPEGADAVQTKLAYLDKALELSNSCATAEEFKSAMQSAFPDYAGENYLDMTAGMLYQE